MRFALRWGDIHNVKMGNIIAASANETAIDRQHIGRINAHDDYSPVDLPEGMPSISRQLAVHCSISFYT